MTAEDYGLAASACYSFSPDMVAAHVPAAWTGGRATADPGGTRPRRPRRAQRAPRLARPPALLGTRARSHETASTQIVLGATTTRV